MKPQVLFGALLLGVCGYLWVGNLTAGRRGVDWGAVEGGIKGRTPHQLERLKELVETELKGRGKSGEEVKKHRKRRLTPRPDEEDEEPETPEPTPVPTRRKKKPHKVTAQHTVLKDYKAHDNPGGTEPEALEERRLMSKLNWPMKSFEDAVWHDTEKPELEEGVAGVLGSNPRLEETYLKAMKKCGLGGKKKNSLKSHADVNMTCYQEVYWARRGGVGSNSDCDKIYSYPSVEIFRKNKLSMCEGEGEGDSDVVCHRRRIRGHSADTSFCEGGNVVVDFSKMPHARDYPWLDFKKGAFTASNCEVSEEAKGKWPTMFIQCVADWFNKGFAQVRSHPQCDVTVATPTYFVTRAGDYSPFHIAHDFLNAYMASAIHGFSFQDLQIVITDRMTKGFYLPLWQWTYTPNHRLLWYPDLKEQYGGKKICYEKAYFNVPARLSLLYNNHEDCTSGLSSTLRGFSDFVLGAFGLVSTSPAEDRIVVTLLVRRNYKTGHKIGRRFGNEDEVFSMLQNLADNVVVNRVDYATYDFDTQMQVSRGTDFLVAMHGAGLIQMMFLPPWGSVFEFFCPEKPPSNFRYRHLAGYLGLGYGSFNIQNQQNEVPVPSVKAKFSEMLEELAERKRRAF